jgi:hypothetical protein
MKINDIFCLFNLVVKNYISCIDFKKNRQKLIKPMKERDFPVVVVGHLRDSSHGLQNNGPCALCSQCDEHIDHLAVSCVFSRQVWFSILSQCNWQQVAPSSQDSFASWWLHAHKRVAKVRRKAFNNLVIIVIWGIWLERNDITFRNVSSTAPMMVDTLWSACKQQVCAKLIGSQLVPGE